MAKFMFAKRGSIWAAIAVVSGCLVGWFGGLPGWWARQSALHALAQRDYSVAWERVRLAARLDHDHSETEFLIARLERKRGNLDRVRRHLQRALTLGLDRNRMHREELLARAQTGELAGIVTELDQLLIDHSEDGAEICDAYANGLLINGQLAEAESLIHQWEQAYPSDPQTDFLRGRIAEFNKNLPLAETCYRNSLTKNQRYFPAANGLGRVLGELNRWEDALQAYEVCLAFQNQAPAKLGMARCLANLGREEDSILLLQSIAKMPQVERNDAFMQLGEQTEFDTFSFELGSLEAKQGHAEEATHWLTLAVEYNPRHREARYQLARALRSSGRAAEAKPHFDWYQATQEKNTEINRVLDQVKLDPQNVDLRCRLGMLYLEIGSENTGRFWLRSVLAQEPAHSIAKEALSKSQTPPR